MENDGGPPGIESYFDSYLRTCEMNTDIVRRKCTEEFQAINEMLDIFDGLGQFVTQVSGAKRVAAEFIPKAESAFMSAQRLIVGGQPAEGVALARTCIESALYCCQIARDTDDAEAERRTRIWLNRHDGDEEFKTCRTMFGFPHTIIKDLTSDKPEIGDYVAKAYQDSIDNGAHPNRRSVEPYWRTYTEDGLYHRNFTIVVDDISLVQPRIRFTIRAAHAATLVFSHTFRDQAQGLVVARQINGLATRLLSQWGPRSH